MANNRMYLRFKPTGEEIQLGKRMVTSGYYINGPKTFADRLNAFYARCLEWLENNDFNEIDAFEIYFELEPAWDLNLSKSR